MKCIWDEADIKCGQVVGKANKSERVTLGFLSNVFNSERFVTVSSLDGMVSNPMTKKELADSLTRYEYLPVELL